VDSAEAPKGQHWAKPTGRAEEFARLRPERLFLEPALNFDPQRRAASPELRASIKAFCRLLEGREAALGLRKRRRSSPAGFRLAIEAIMCNLAVLHILGKHRLLAVPRHSGAMWGKGRYGSPVVGQHFRTSWMC
jgi:hypothetical protein